MREEEVSVIRWHRGSGALLDDLRVAFAKSGTYQASALIPDREALREDGVAEDMEQAVETLLGPAR